MSNTNELQTTNEAQNNTLGLMDIDNAVKHYAAFNLFKQAICKKEIDFGVIPGTKKPSLFQPGAQKLAKAFKLVVSLQLESRTVDAQTGFVSYEYRAIATRDGVFLGEGIGSCNSYEDKYAFTAWHPEAQPDTKTQNELKAANLGANKKEYSSGQWVWNQRERKHAPDLIALQNTIMKMAGKRAFVHCILNTTGGGEFFAQDIEDMPHLKDEAQKTDELTDGVYFALSLCITLDECKKLWAMVPHLQKDANFITAVKAKSEQIKGNE